MKALENHLRRFSRAHHTSVDCHIRVRRNFVRIVDSGKAADLSAPRFCIKAFDVAALTLFHGRRHIDFDEVVAKSADELSRFFVRRYQGCNHRNAVVFQSARNEPDAANVSLALLTAESRLRKHFAN